MEPKVPTAYYRHSGSFGSTALPIMLAASALMAAVGAIVYAYAINYIPLIYLNILLTCGYGALLGWAVGLAGKALKVRNMPLMLIAGVFAGLVGVYVMWPTWLGVFLQRAASASGESMDMATEFRAIWAFATNPGAMLAILDEIAAKGIWSLKGTTVSGLALVLVWIAEALIVVGFSAGVAGRYLATSPFCERCDAWFSEKTQNDKLMPPPNSQAMIAEAEDDNIAPMLALKSLHPALSVRTKLTLLSCPKCGEAHALSASILETVQTAKNKTEEREHKLATNLLLSKEHAAQLRAHLTSPPAAPTDDELKAMFPPAQPAAAPAAAAR